MSIDRLMAIWGLCLLSLLGACRGALGRRGTATTNITSNATPAPSASLRVRLSYGIFESSGGSAVLLGPRLIATARHVIDMPRGGAAFPWQHRVFVRSGSGEEVSVDGICAESAELDLITLRLSRPLHGVTPFRILDRHSVPGEHVLLVDSHEDPARPRITAGTVFACPEQGPGDFCVRAVGVRPGSSGGAVVSPSGELLGVVTRWIHSSVYGDHVLAARVATIMREPCPTPKSVDEWSRENDASGRQRARSYLDDGRSALLQGKAEEAISDMEHALALPLGAGERPIAWRTLVDALAQAGRPDDAVVRTRVLVKAPPRLAWAHVVHARALQGVGDQAAAMAQMRMAIRLAPERRDWALQVAKAQLGLGHPREALVTLQGAKFRDDDANVAQLRGQIHAAMGNLSAAAGEYIRALTLDPERVDTVESLAEMAESLLVSDEGRVIDPLVNHTKYIQARDLLWAAVLHAGARPSFSRLYFYLAIAQAGLGERKRAESYLARTVQVTPAEGRRLVPIVVWLLARADDGN